MRIHSMLAATAALALSSGAALAQAGPGGTMPAGPNTAPGGANGAASTSTSTTIDSPTDDRNEAMGMRRDVSTGRNDDPRAVAITDEYGNRYNSRGERIGRGAPDR